MEHSKTPWKLYNGKLVPEYPNKIVEVQDENGKAICKWTGFDGADQSPAIRKANAAFIVEACNNYERLRAENKELLEAFKELIEEIDNGLVSGNRVRREIIYQRIRTQIAKAGEK